MNNQLSTRKVELQALAKKPTSAKSGIKVLVDVVYSVTSDMSLVVFACH